MQNLKDFPQEVLIIVTGDQFSFITCAALFLKQYIAVSQSSDRSNFFMYPLESTISREVTSKTNSFSGIYLKSGPRKQDTFPKQIFAIVSQDQED